jgi:1-acyl-sn-glycerol-3-phosphate acyltransferase
MTATPRDPRRDPRRGVGVASTPGTRAEGEPAGSEARIIPLHADDSGTRTRWRLDRTGDHGGAKIGSGVPPQESQPESPQESPREAQPESSPSEPAAWELTLAELLAFLRRRLAGDYPVDDFGFDAELTDTLLLPALRPLYQRWFRVETIGMHHVPTTGGALVVANHSGTVPLDCLMLAVALHDDHPEQRHLRMLGADLVFRMPVLGALARKQGSTLACNPDAERLLADGELVGVWPEGFKGIGKPFRDRYKLQRFGRGGFVSAALRTGAPIIPCSIVGAEETYPKIGDIKPLARLLGAPYVPVTPTFPLLGPLGLIPLPSKWYIEFGEPIRTDSLGAAAADDPMTVFNLNDQVRETIQHTLYRLLSQRRNPFLG